MNCQKDFVEYIDRIFYSESKDTNAIKNSVDMFFEFYKKHEINAETVFFLKLIRDKIIEDCQDKIEDVDVEDVVTLASCFFGLILGKFSKKVKVPNYML